MLTGMSGREDEGRRRDPKAPPKDQPPTDGVAELIAAARANPHDYLAYLLMLYWHGQKILARRDFPEVCDLYGSSAVAQDAFLKAAVSFKQFSGITESEFHNWLGLIRRDIGRLLTRRLHRQCRDPGREIPLGPDEDSGFLEWPDPSQPPADEAAILREESLRARAALRLLPEGWAEVIRLHLDDGLTFAEIGHRFDEAAEAVRTRYRRGIRALRTILEYRGGGGVQTNVTV